MDFKLLLKCRQEVSQWLEFGVLSHEVTIQTSTNNDATREPTHKGQYKKYLAAAEDEIKEDLAGTGKETLRPRRKNKGMKQWMNDDTEIDDIKI